ncbi:MAG: hypothetical protein GWN00_39345 [Aliifodinibius sp.]|nr:hypothetical protein [Fodinibius sp.]NIW99853.1 hypothetical protein [Phycisphaerae bacterium]NIY30619.1 hypothetical protein [Fodinibius sp.]
MNHYEFRELISLWERNKLTIEQAIGQILLILLSINQRLLKLEATDQKKD